MTSFLQGCFTAAITIGFILLAVYAWHKHPPVHREAATSEGEFVQQKLAEYHPQDVGTLYRARSKVVYVWKNARAAAIAEALSLTPGDLDTTVDVRGQP